MAYGFIRDLHVTFVVITGLFFFVRAVASVLGAGWLQQRWARTLPHFVDTLLLILGVWMLVRLGLWPTELPWLTAKLIALVLYILFGAWAIKRARTRWGRVVCAVLALLVFGYMVLVALTKSVVPWA